MFVSVRRSHGCENAAELLLRVSRFWVSSQFARIGRADVALGSTLELRRVTSPPLEVTVTELSGAMVEK